MLPSKKSLKRSLDLAEGRIAGLKKKLRNSKNKEKRCRQTLADIIKDLEEKKLIEKELTKTLDLYSGIYKNINLFQIA